MQGGTILRFVILLSLLTNSTFFFLYICCQVTFKINTIHARWYYSEVCHLAVPSDKQLGFFCWYICCQVTLKINAIHAGGGGWGCYYSEACHLAVPSPSSSSSGPRSTTEL